MHKNIHKQIFSERSQNFTTRTQLFEGVEEHLGGRTLVTFFTSFNHFVDIDNDDCDMLQSVLQHIDVSKGLALMISSPGGDGLAATGWRRSVLLILAEPIAAQVTIGLSCPVKQNLPLPLYAWAQAKFSWLPRRNWVQWTLR
jgi:hypothetical protein